MTSDGSESIFLGAAEALGCALGTRTGESLQWVIYNAESDSQPVYAWVFAPAAMFAGQRDERALGAIGGTEAYRLLADEAERAIAAIGAARDPSPKLSPIIASARGDGGLLWMKTRRVAGAADGAIASARPIREIIMGLTDALSSLHRAGVLHLDVHPEMLTMDEGIGPVLRGFGVDMRRSLAADASSNHALGRPGFSAPELWDATGKSRLGPWTDVYGAAATLFFFLTGAPPADFRERMREPARARGTLREALTQHLDRGEPGTRRIANMIVAGLSPWPEERPADIATWLRAMGVEPMPLELNEPAAAAEKGEEPMVEPLSGARLVGARPRRTLRNFIVLILLGAGAAVAINSYREANPTRDESPVGNLTSDGMPSPSLTGLPNPPRSVVPTRTIAGIEIQDDPARLTTILRELWGTIPADHPARRYFRAFRESGGGCDNPLKLHLRKDGRGFVVVRPAGLVWITEWDRARSRTAGALTVTIASVNGDGGEMAVPGLTGTARRLEMTANALNLIFLGDGQPSERETYLACEGGSRPS